MIALKEKKTEYWKLGLIHLTIEIFSRELFLVFRIKEDLLKHVKVSK